MVVLLLLIAGAEQLVESSETVFLTSAVDGSSAYLRRHRSRKRMGFGTAVGRNSYSEIVCLVILSGRDGERKVERKIDHQDSLLVAENGDKKRNRLSFV